MPRTSNTPQTLNVPEIDNIKDINGVKHFLRQLVNILKTDHIRLRTDIITQLKDGVSGNFDDGTNFKITVVDGVITEIEDSVSGGHS